MKAQIFMLLLVFFFGFNGFSQNLTNPEEENILNEKKEFGNFVPTNFPIPKFSKAQN